MAAIIEQDRRTSLGRFSASIAKALQPSSSAMPKSEAIQSVANARAPSPDHQPAEPTPTTFTPPDGGKNAWQTVIAGWLCQFCSFGFINALGSFQLIYETDILKTKSSSSISWIMTMQLFLMFFLSQPVGMIVDMFGPRAILMPTSVLAVVGLLGLSFAKEYWQIFLAQSLCFGLGAAGIFVPGLVAASQYFKKRRAFAVGLVASGSSVGGVVFPIFIAQLFNKIGFRATIRWTALLIGVLLFIANILVVPPMQPKGWAGRRTLLSVNVFKKPSYLFFVGGSFMFFWGLFGPFNYLPLFAEQAKETYKLAPYSVSILNAASIFGRIFPPLYSDRVGHLRVITMCAFLSGFAVLVMWLPIDLHHSLGGLVFFALFFGFFSGAFVSLITPCVVEVAGGHTHDLGAMVGTYFAIAAVASLTGLPIQGAISKGGDLMGLIIFSGVTMVVGSAALACALFRSLERKATQKQALTQSEK
ncbi:major facilitator superfamily domain-containing protein [Clohesyomyces aquaticus]|uniref:Major facilitator superfamily domain-containing protein n=1 Tax=Clohesyomyces aquaticus TaxID=1231657 RepID=A0A1Y1Y953_9PLEO|nr:major facilitator superfamily domain-containing protein [Clohesyomyces aquaticus]